MTESSTVDLKIMRYVWGLNNKLWAVAYAAIGPAASFRLAPSESAGFTKRTATAIIDETSATGENMEAIT